MTYTNGGLMQSKKPTNYTEIGWYGRSLENYKAIHPKAKVAKTLTEARKLAFGMKKGNKK